MKRKRQKKISALILLLAITIGYALLSTTLKINGTAGIKSNTWGIHWENVQPNNNSTVTAEKPTISENATKVSYEVTLELPGDYYEFTVDAVNSGSINGKISEVKSTIYVLDPTTGEEVIDPQTNKPQTTNLPSYINYTIYYDGTTNSPKQGDILEANGGKQTYRIRIEFDEDAEVLPETDLSFKMVDEITYTQTKEEKSSSAGAQLIQNSTTPDNIGKGPVAVTHNATVQVPAKTDYRYMGTDPDNYILFNCDSDNPEEQDTTTCEVWRIIGVFDNKLKIINPTEYSYLNICTRNNETDDYENCLQVNSWTDSDIYTYLNTTYYNGLKSTAKSKIENSTWYLGGWSFIEDGLDAFGELRGFGQYPEGAYIKERGNEVYSGTSLNTTAKVGLLYPSDFGFSMSECYSMCVASSEACNNQYLVGQNGFAWSAIIDGKRYSYGSEDYDYSKGKFVISDYENDTIVEFEPNRCDQYTTWLGDDFSDGGFETITPIHFFDSQSRLLDTGISGGDSIHPTVYLKESINITGTGTQSNPYKITTS